MKRVNLKVRSAIANKHVNHSNHEKILLKDQNKSLQKMKQQDRLLIINYWNNFQNPGRAYGLCAKFNKSGVSKSWRVALSTNSDVIFCHTGNY